MSTADTETPASSSVVTVADPSPPAAPVMIAALPSGLVMRHLEVKIGNTALRPLMKAHPHGWLGEQLLPGGVQIVQRHALDIVEDGCARAVERDIPDDDWRVGETVELRGQDGEGLQPPGRADLAPLRCLDVTGVAEPPGWHQGALALRAYRAHDPPVAELGKKAAGGVAGEVLVAEVPVPG